jgi:5-methylcytosine-specific restriction protein A
VPKLKTIKPMLSTIKPLIGRMPGDERGRDRERERDQHWRKWYHSARWKTLRMQVLTRDLFTCQMCGKLEGNTSLLVCDHKRAHKGDAILFWSEANLQAVCKPCHDGEKQRMDKRARFSYK